MPSTPSPAATSRVTLPALSVMFRVLARIRLIRFIPLAQPRSSWSAGGFGAFRGTTASCISCCRITSKHLFAEPDLVGSAAITLLKNTPLPRSLHRFGTAWFISFRRSRLQQIPNEERHTP